MINFEQKESRADFRYIPLCKPLTESMYMPDLSQKENRELLIKTLDNYINE